MLSLPELLHIRLFHLTDHALDELLGGIFVQTGLGVEDETVAAHEREHLRHIVRDHIVAPGKVSVGLGRAADRAG